MIDITARMGLRISVGELLDQVEDGFINPRLELYKCTHAENVSHGRSQAPMDTLVCSRYKCRYHSAISIILHGFEEITLSGN